MKARRWLTMAVLLVVGLTLHGCGSKKSKPPAKTPVSKSPAPYQQSKQDGAPWWDKDVSGIPDAVPTPHYGPVKAAPYVVLGKKYYPIQSAHNYRETGLASWYGTKFHGLHTANGETYDLYGMTAAHKTLPLPSYVKVTNLDNGRSVTLRVNDRGPFYSDRIIDLSFAAAKKLGYADKGVARVRVEGIDPVKWQAQHGRKSQAVAAAAPTVEPVRQTAVETYVPPAQQHAGALSPAEIGRQVEPRGMYLQIGAFANPDAAQLLSDRIGRVVSESVRISPVVRGDQVLHRVRVGPLKGNGQADSLSQQIRWAGLGNPALIQVE